MIGIRHVGLITLGDLLLVMAYVAQLYDPLRTISGKIPELQSWRVSLERAFALFDENPELGQSVTLSAPVRRAAGHIVFDNVSFLYTSGTKALDEVSFSIPAGTKVGIVGQSGSGKTTLINLLARFYEPTRGRILLDDISLHDFGIAELRQQIAIISQEPVLFSATIADNIAYGRVDASRAEIICAATGAHAHQFIMDLPRRYDTKIGECGSSLSGGQRQRLAIARAYLKSAPLLILDEPTSALDVATEADLVASMKEVIEGRTAFLIAHRLNTIRSCDLLLVMEKGRLKEMIWQQEAQSSRAESMEALLRFSPTA